MKTILGIETSCDETAVAIIKGNHTRSKVLSSEIYSQIPIHRQHGGVVPELASRNHGLNIRPVLDLALRNAKLTPHQLDAVCATAGPGLASSLLVGHTTAKGIAVAAKKPFYSINHMEGHLLSPFLEKENGIEQNIALVVSGGHTMILKCDGFSQYSMLGRTKDDAAGEAFDKVAKMLGLNYPGGPEIEKLAKTGNPKAFQFPRSMKHSQYDFSFSGLKTAVLYTLAELSPQDGIPTPAILPDLCASFQEAVIEVLVKKTIKAAVNYNLKKITISGGVSCNNELRQRLAIEAEKKNISFTPCDKAMSSDNAAMIAYVGLHKLLNEEASSLEDDISPNMPLNNLQLRK